MQIVDAHFMIESDIKGHDILAFIEKVGRTAYKSEDRVTSSSAHTFVGRLVKHGHLAVIEHVTVTVRIFCDRGVSHEIVRHRLASYCQESTRYCNYSRDKFGNEICVVRPCFWNPENPEDKRKIMAWENAMRTAEKAYFELLTLGASPQEARSVLPNSLKTEIVVTMNLREWRNFFQLRAASDAHPQMQEIAIPLLAEFQQRIPVVFDDLSA
ncbi:MAG: FAD-dependent thymidylate synthase [Candidatus Pacebacteria bacterium]|nr:FAD-dependent thymidylate synthase [Candidatus Paceibacterota bacterium]